MATATTPKGDADRAQREAKAEKDEAAKLAKLQEAAKVTPIDEIPKTRAPRKPSDLPSVWALRLANVANPELAPSGKALIYSCDKATTANSMAYGVRQKLRKGEFDAVLGEKATERFRFVVHGTDIYGEVIAPA